MTTSNDSNLDTLDGYQSVALETLKPNMTSHEKLEMAHLGLAGETGEVLENFKKFRFHHRELSEFREKALYEMGDVLWYLSAMASALGYTLSEVAERNIQKLRDKQASWQRRP